MIGHSFGNPASLPLGPPIDTRYPDARIEALAPRLTARLGNAAIERSATGFRDGLRTDVDGNVWCSMGWADPAEDDVRCYAPGGDLIGKIHLPERCANVCFGGKKGDRRFMAASTSVYSLYLNTTGAMRP